MSVLYVCSHAHSVGPELDDGSVVECVDLPGEGQPPGADVGLCLVHLSVVVGSGLFEHILHRGVRD